MEVRKLLIISLIFFATTPVLPQVASVQAGGRSAGLGYASVALSDLWSSFNNQAGLYRIHDIQAGIFYENRFILKELGYKALAVAVPVGNGTFGLTLNHFGYQAYNESKVGIGYGRSFGKYVAFGLQLDYNRVQIDEEYGNSNSVTFELGLLANLTDDLTLGAHVYNPLSFKLNESRETDTPTIFRLGAAYTLTDNILVSAEVEKNMQFDPVVKGGVEYRIIPELSVRGGISNGLSMYTFGTGIYLGGLMIDVSMGFHQYLGFTPQASLGYKF